VRGRIEPHPLSSSWMDGSTGKHGPLRRAGEAGAVRGRGAPHRGGGDQGREPGGHRGGEREKDEDGGEDAGKGAGQGGGAGGGAGRTARRPAWTRGGGSGRTEA